MDISEGVDWTERHSLLCGGVDRCTEAARTICDTHHLGELVEWWFVRAGGFGIRGTHGSIVLPRFPWEKEV